MPYQRSGGKQCVVLQCSNSQKKLYDWNISLCHEHKIEHKDCACLPPYKLHCIPANEEKRRLWIKSLNRKGFNPASKSLVCSIHFVDRRPTKENPIPVLNMGYTAPYTTTPARRPPLVRKSLNMNTPKSTTSKQMSTPETSYTSELLTATPLPASVYKFGTEDTQECLSTCCTLNPGQCDNKPKMA